MCKQTSHPKLSYRRILLACRDVAQHIVERSYRLVDILKDIKPETAVNVDDLLLRESMDVIGGSMCSSYDLSCPASPLLHSQPEPSKS